MDVNINDKTIQLKNLRKEIEEKSSARKRLELLFDKGTFVEIGAFVKQRPTEFNQVSAAVEGVVTGYGAVNGILVFAFAQDPAVLSGSISEMHAAKICNLIDMAIKADAPVVSMIDSNGLRLLEGIDALNGYGKILSKFNELAGNIIHVSIVFGTCAGALSFVPAISDYSVMLKKAELFLSSPDVVAARLGDKKAGTSEVAYKNGMVSAVCESEEEAVEKAKEFIGTICDISISSDDINRLVPELETILSTEAYDMKNVIKTIADDGKVLYLSDGNAKNMITALISLNCSTIGVVANQPTEKNGALDGKAALKANKFIGFCDDFGIPVLSLVDTNGFDVDLNENIEESSLLLNAFANAAVPKISLVVGKAYGSGYLSMCSKATGADLCLALPTAQIAALPADTGAIFLNDKKIANSGDPIKEREKLIEEYKNILASPYEAAKRGYIDDIIEPSTVRQLLVSSFEMLADKQ
jgi:acetyl-CoA carboxylase carboxyltransferase component